MRVRPIDPGEVPVIEVPVIDVAPARDGAGVHPCFEAASVCAEDLLRGFAHGTGGFKTTPTAVRMRGWPIVKDEPHELIRDFGLDRFERGRCVPENGVSFSR